MKIEEQVNLAPWTTMKIGGRADFAIRVNALDDLRAALSFAYDRRLPIAAIGGGSNLLIADEGFRGLVIKMEAQDIRIEGQRIMADAGALFARVASLAAEQGLSGLECGIGIPGTIGGAVVGNAGNKCGECKDVIEEVEIFDENLNIRRLSRQECEFQYRESIFKHRPWIVRRVLLALHPDDPKAIKERMADLIDFKHETQSTAFANSGCMFRNHVLRTPGDYRNANERGISHLVFRSPFLKCDIISAGALIDQGLKMKGFQHGGIRISEKHANFLLNVDGGTAQQVLELVAMIKARVREQFGIELHEEFRKIG